MGKKVCERETKKRASWMVDLENLSLVTIR